GREHEHAGAGRIRSDGVAAQGRLADDAAVLAADRFRLFRSVALRRAHVEARRVHGRRRLRAVARQLSDDGAHGGTACAGGGAPAAPWTLTAGEASAERS